MDTVSNLEESSTLSHLCMRTPIVDVWRMTDLAMRSLSASLHRTTIICPGRPFFIVAGSTLTSRAPSSIMARKASPRSSGVISSRLHSICVIVGVLGSDSPRNARSMSATPSVSMLPKPVPTLS